MKIYEGWFEYDNVYGCFSYGTSYIGEDLDKCKDSLRDERIVDMVPSLIFEISGDIRKGMRIWENGKVISEEKIK